MPGCMAEPAYMRIRRYRILVIQISRPIKINVLSMFGSVAISNGKKVLPLYRTLLLVLQVRARFQQLIKMANYSLQIGMFFNDSNADSDSGDEFWSSRCTTLILTDRIKTILTMNGHLTLKNRLRATQNRHTFS